MVHVKPYMGCNLGCLYCSQSDFHEHLGRPGTAQKMNFDINAILQRLEEIVPRSKTVILHGGEPTMIGRDNAEKIFAKAISLGGRCGIQTNGWLIDDKWIELFKKYHVSVGISYDGVGDLNSARGFFDKDGNRKNEISDKYSGKVEQTIYKLKEEGVGVGVIVVLNKLNGLNPNRQKLKEWIAKLSDMGIGGRLNLAFIDDPKIKPLLELTPQEATQCWMDLAEFVLEKSNRMWQPFREMVDNLLGLDLGSCHYTACNPLKTNGEINIGSHGQIENCSRLNDNGYPRWRGDMEQDSDYSRSIMLYLKPEREGGCGGCRYFSVCGGGCPAQGWDFKNNKKDEWSKDRFCMAIKGAYSVVERKLKAIMPNLITVPDKERNLSVNDILASMAERSRRSAQFNAFEWMLPQTSQSPSSYTLRARAKK
jgi:uncharacterized protein